ncbi:hypothetical protein [Rhizobium sp. R693]|uniref:hypothetical protein n=1 Tax=Rhizobium sp. R693 TaxID=1764276 RepID=UPI000B531F62|nr:hypothetical protein [Rhizobium sp. R693]OWV99181.1 hypothetical protein ATY79_18520 [Rhizobium sp. R693]
MHNIGFVITVVETDDVIEFEVEFFVRIEGDVVRGTLEEVLVAIGAANLRRLLKQEAEKLYAILSDRLGRLHAGNSIEVNILRIGAFSTVMIAGLGYPVRSFADAADVEASFIPGKACEPTPTIPSP